MARIVGVLDKQEIERIPRGMPYYSGLQPAIWRVTHLRACLASASDIWSFEHIVDRSTPHYAVRRHALKSIHVVERGRWLPRAKSLFAAAGLPFDSGSRETWPASAQARILYGDAKFAVAGYTGIRLRRLRDRFRWRRGS
jgi:hypothetical protein